MKLFQYYDYMGDLKPGVFIGDNPFDLDYVMGGDSELYSTVDVILDYDRVKAGVSAFNGGTQLEDVEYGPCVTSPEKILCVGLNYKKHAAESGMDIPEHPIIFSKFNNSLAASGDEIILLDSASEYDYEVELGVIIGKETKKVSVEDALGHVFGYCTLNDLSVRDLQTRTSQWLLGKSLDGFLPAGPHIVTSGTVGDPQNLAMKTWVNNDLRQDSNTSDMIFSVAECVSYLSQYMTLVPGDLISTGTPEGVVLGRKEKDWLKAGDIVKVEVEGLGVCENVMAKE